MKSGALLTVEDENKQTGKLQKHGINIKVE